MSHSNAFKRILQRKGNLYLDAHQKSIQFTAWTSITTWTSSLGFSMISVLTIVPFISRRLSTSIYCSSSSAPSHFHEHVLTNSSYSQSSGFSSETGRAKIYVWAEIGGSNVAKAGSCGAEVGMIVEPGVSAFESGVKEPSGWTETFSREYSCDSSRTWVHTVSGKVVWGTYISFEDIE